MNDASGAVSLGTLAFPASLLSGGQGGWVQSRTFTFSVRELAPGDAVNSEGVSWANATEAQRAAGGFSKDNIAYSADVPVAVTLHVDEDTGVLVADVSYDGLAAGTVVNTYTRPADPSKPDGKTPTPTWSDPPVEKVVMGSPDTMPNFTFTMRALTPGAPMPAGSSNGSKTVVVNGSGAVEFGVMEYDEAGVYRYEIAESDDASGDGWTYDTSTYGVTVTVTADAEGNLSAARSFTKDGVPIQVATIQVVNSYEDPGEVTDEPGDKPVDGDGSGSSSSSGPGPKGSKGHGSGGAEGILAKTGDNREMPLLVLLGAAALASLTIGAARRRMEPGA